MQQTSDKVTKEDQLLLILSNFELDENQTSLISNNFASAQLDWETIIKSAEYHHVDLLLDHSIRWLESRGIVFASLTEATRQRFSESVRPKQDYVSQSIQEFSQIAVDLAHKGVIPILLKGPALESTIYNSAGVRYFKDFDVLLHDQEFEIIHDVLLKRGYIQGRYDQSSGDILPVEPSLATSRILNKRHPPGYQKLAPVRIYNPIYEVEVHGPTTNETFLHQDASILFANTEISNINGVPIRTLSPIDTIIYLAAHAYVHMYTLTSFRNFGYTILSYFCDIRDVFRGRQAQSCSTNIWIRAAQLNCANQVFYALYHVEELFPGTVPAKLLIPPNCLTATPEEVIDDRWEFLGGSSVFVQRLFHPSVDIDRLRTLRAQQVAGGRYTLQFLQESPLIDGVLDDSCWRSASFEKVSGVGDVPEWQYFRTHVAYGQPPRNDDDLSFRFALGWTNHALIVAVEVTDDTLIFNQLQGYYHLQDCVQILIEAPLHSRKYANILLVPQATDLNKPGVFVYLQGTKRGTAAVEGSQIGVMYSKKGYSIEASLPLDEIGLDIRPLTPFGLDIVVYDTDESSRERKTVLAWSGGRNAMRNPETYGVAILAPH